MFEPGRKSIAHGELKVATAAVVNGGSAAGLSALVDDEAPQLANARKRPACAMFLLIRLRSFSKA
jgi:hypothetical protein